MSDEKQNTTRRKPKQSIFYKPDAAGVHLFLKTGNDVLFLATYPTGSDYGAYIIKHVKQEKKPVKMVALDANYR